MTNKIRVILKNYGQVNNHQNRFYQTIQTETIDRYPQPVEFDLHKDMVGKNLWPIDTILDLEFWTGGNYSKDRTRIFNKNEIATAFVVSQPQQASRPQTANQITQSAPVQQPADDNDLPF
jgi:hypothetical protein